MDTDWTGQAITLIERCSDTLTGWTGIEDIVHIYSLDRIFHRLSAGNDTITINSIRLYAQGHRLHLPPSGEILFVNKYGKGIKEFEKIVKGRKGNIDVKRPIHIDKYWEGEEFLPFEAETLLCAFIQEICTSLQNLSDICARIKNSTEDPHPSVLIYSEFDLLRRYSVDLDTLILFYRYSYY